VAVAVTALAVSALVAPVVSWSAGSALGTTPQTITFAPLADRTLNEPALVVSATSSSGLGVNFSTTTPAVCSSTGTSGTVISPIIEGVCTVRASQPGDAVFAAAPPVAQSFTVTKGSQTITFPPIDDRELDQGPLTVSATSSIGFAVTFTTTTPAVCTSSGTHGATITPISSGTCTVRADQAGNAIFAAAPPVMQSFSIGKATQAITFSPLDDKTTLQSPLVVSAASSSFLTVTFTTTTPSVCTAGGLNGTVITFVGFGTCTVQADQAGNASFSPAPPVQRSFLITRAAQTITFGALADHGTIDSPVSVAATSSSGLAVTFTTTTPAVCTAGGVRGATIVLLTAGTCTVQADQVGNAIYAPASPIAQSFLVTKSSQAITFAALGDRTVLQTPLTVSATASSQLPVTFSAPSTPAVCSSGGTRGVTITLLAPGTCTVEADQAGNIAFNAAPPVVQSFTVTKAPQTVAFGATPNVPLGAPVTISATASSGLVVTITAVTPAVCTAGGTNGATISFVAPGTCTVEGNQAGDARFDPAPPVQRSFGVGRTDQSIAFPALRDTTLSHSPLTMHATASSHLPVTFTSATPAVCHTSGALGATLTLSKLGVCKVRATQAGNTVFNAASPVDRQFAVASSVSSSGAAGYWMLGSDGHVYAFGSATNLGSSGAPAVAFSARRDGGGYWIVDASGDVRAFGRATYHGGRPPLRFAEFVSTISSTPSGNGYWLFTTQGRAFPYGDAHFFGDMSAVRLNGPVIASTATPTGRGYYMVGSDGGVFSFGDARFHGSMGNARLNRPIVGLSPTPDNRGYWLVASDGGVFAFSAPFRGSLGAVVLNKPVNGLVAYGNGYLMVASDGGVFTFSNKAFVGSLGNNPPSAPIVGIATALGT
jgi:hypothetical protein